MRCHSVFISTALVSFFHCVACCMYSLTIVLLQRVGFFQLLLSINIQRVLLCTHIHHCPHAACPYRFIVLVNTLGCSQKQYGNHQFCISILMPRNVFEWLHSYQYTPSGALHRRRIKQYVHQQTHRAHWPV